LTDPYRILGVSRNAGIEEIKQAFRTRARQSHPDSNRGNPDAEEQFKTLLAAYEKISDEWKSRRVDPEAANGNRRPAGDATHSASNREERPSSESVDGCDDVDGRAGSSDGTASSFRVKGTDVTYTLPVTFEEAANGVTRSIDMVTGRKLSVKVPPGVLDGHILRLRGEGIPGMGERARGDALVEVRVASHPLFVREGHDIHIDVAVTLPEAVLGGRVDVPTVGGTVKVSVPPGSNTGSVLRLRDKGLPRAKGGCGDQYITLRVMLPSSPDDEFIQFVKRWHAEHPYTVRKL